MKKTRSIFWAGLFILISASQLRAQGEKRIKEFTIVGYEGIMSDLRSGEGPYLKSLTELLKTPPDQQILIVDQIRSLSTTYPNILDFAEQVSRIQVVANITLPAGAGVYTADLLENALNHLTRGMKVTVFSKDGAQVSGQFDEYYIRRLWITGASRTSFPLDDIFAVQSPQL